MRKKMFFLLAFCAYGSTASAGAISIKSNDGACIAAIASLITRDDTTDADALLGKKSPPKEAGQKELPQSMKTDYLSQLKKAGCE